MAQSSGVKGIEELGDGGADGLDGARGRFA
jgi:hypothetical protein